MKSTKAMTSTQRVRKHRKRMKSDGGRLVHVQLDKQAIFHLEQIHVEVGWTQAKIISEALEMYYKNID